MRCRINFRFYMLLLCAVYFAMLYVFHGSLQSESKVSDKDKTYLNNAVQTGILKIKSPIDVKRKVLASHQDFLETTIKNVQRIHTSVTNKNENDQNKSTYQHLPEPAKCFLPATNPNRTFLALESKFYVYSAYMDERYEDIMLRIMAVLSLNKSNRNLKAFCNFRNRNGLLKQEPARFYELCENHGRQFGGFMLSCPVNHKNICQVNVTLEIEAVHKNYKIPETVAVPLPVTELNLTITTNETTGSFQKRMQYNFTICVPPLFGNVDLTRFVEFIELNKLLGFQHFIFYISNVKNPDMFKVLEHYRQEGLVTTIDWNLPSVIHSGHIWYNGQLSAHNDCLYRAMALTEYLAVIDIDEYIVPHNGHKTLTKVIPKLFGPNVCGLSFESAFFDKKFTKSKSQSKLVTVRNTGRSAVFSKVRTKVLVKPSRIFEVGIHHISKPALEDYKVQKVDTSVAYLHHYRDCVPNYGMKCAAFTEDNTLLKYSSELESSVKNMFRLVFANRSQQY